MYFWLKLSISEILGQVQVAIIGVVVIEILTRQNVKNRPKEISLCVMIFVKAMTEQVKFYTKNKKFYKIFTWDQYILETNNLWVKD